MASDLWKVAEPKLASPEAPSMSKPLKDLAMTLQLSSAQAAVLEKLRDDIGSWPGKLAAVRSSAPEEDGAGASFAGVFETKLGVTAPTLEMAVRECFASVFDYRVFSYKQEKHKPNRPAFAAVVMEMVDSHKAGVAFSANPLNSDLDEMVVDSSWGLGESVVDGSVTADRLIWDKVGKKMVHQQIGSKMQECRLRSGSGGVEVRPVEAARQEQCTLSEEELAQLAGLVGAVEVIYGMPMDTEWAFTEGGQLKLLQARPITTLYALDPEMMTRPGEKRVLYFDFNIASDATTISPFTHMDLTIYSEQSFLMWGMDKVILQVDPNQIYFNGATRQYFNFSHMMRLGGSPREMAKYYGLLDAYLAAIFNGDECTEANYKSVALPAECNLANAWWLLRKFPLFKMAYRYYKFKWAPKQSNRDIDEALRAYRRKLKELIARGPVEKGLGSHLDELSHALATVMNMVVGGAWTALGLWKELDGIRRNGKTEKEKQDAEDLMGGFPGDPVMEINISMFKLARKLPVEVWKEYDGQLGRLGERIQQNLRGEIGDLPQEFLEEWREFMENHGYDGIDQVFVSSPRYYEDPELLLAKIRHSIGDVKDPNSLLLEKSEKRKKVQEAQLAAAGLFSSGKIKKRNLHLDEVLWVRNMPKQLWSQNVAAMRTAILACEAKLLATDRLDHAGDIFFLKVQEVDQALTDLCMDVRSMLKPRKDRYLHAKQAKTCPHLIDSRGRILKPNPVASAPGTLVGTAISPGVAEGAVRFMTSPSDHFEHGDILVTVLTDPSWTPLFVSCSAVILQIGGALQHGALCAREYGKPAVAGIDVMGLKTGTRVSVDGNTGVVKFLDFEPERTEVASSNL